jgi:DNA polymerase III sliding clamp (beta) subunit (PCNA family)
LPHNAVDALVPALRQSPNDETVQLAVGEHAIVFETSEFSLSAVLAAGSFPPWCQVCPRDDEGSRMLFKCGLGTVALRNAIEQSARATTTDPGGTFTFDQNWLTIQVVDGEDPKKSLSTVRVESALASPHVSSCAKFNLTYWQEAMASIPKGSNIEIQFGSDELDAIVIHAGNAFHVIMPMRQ